MDSFQTTSDAYLAAVETLLDMPDFVVAPRGLPCSELMNWQFVVEQPKSGPVTTKDPIRDAVMATYLAAEERLYLSGEMRAEVWASQASKFWQGLANTDGTINSNYGWLAFRNQSLPNGWTPWDWAKSSLLADRESRQAFVRFSLPRHQRPEVKDQVCTMHLNFMIREDRLHATTVMRSNDVIKGLPYDMPWFCQLTERMANEVSARVGTYTHFAHSLHLYNRDRKTAERLVGR